MLPPLRRLLAGAALLCWGPGVLPAVPGTPAVRVVAEDGDGVVLGFEFAPVAVATDDAGRVILTAAGAGLLHEPGRPVVPRVTALVALPPGTQPELDVVAEDWRAAPPLALDPWIRPAGDFTEPSTLAADEFARPWPGAPCVVSAGRLRGHDVALLEFYPARWTATTRATEFLRSATVRIRHRPAPAATPGVVPAGPGGDPYFDAPMAALVVNPSALERSSAAPSRAAAQIVPHAPTATNATFPPVRISVSRAGLYQVKGSDLTAAGVNLAGVDPRTLQLTSNGSPVDIVLEGEQDGVFDPADAVVFWGVALDTRYTGTNVYWLAQATGTAPRMATRDTTPHGAAEVTAFRASLRGEGSLLYDSNAPAAQPAEHWWWERLDAPPNSTYGSISDTYKATLHNMPASASNARLRFNVQGRSNMTPKPDHETLLYVNGTQVDDQSWSGLAAFTHDVSFPASRLVDGVNTFRLEVRAPAGVSFSSILSNWFSLDYDSRYVASSDALGFVIPANPATVRLGGFTSSSITVLDTTVPEHPVRLTGGDVAQESGAWRVLFQDVPAAGATYHGAAVAGRLTPDTIEKPALTTWKSTANGADLIIVTHPDFASAAQSIADRRRAEGLRVAVTLVPDIVNEFAAGVSSPTAIRDFLAYAYASWQRPAPAFVLMFGDANIDYRNYLGQGNNWVPTQLAGPLTYIGETMTDNWFVQVDGSDILPDMYVGRVTPRSPAEAQAAAGKIVAYSTTPPAATVSDSVLFIADDGLNTFDSTFQDVSDSLATYVRPPLAPQKVYASQYASNAAIRGAIRGGIGGGTVITNYFGHGNKGLWGSKLGEFGNFFDGTQIDTLTNGTDQTFVLALNCVNGYFADILNQNMAEKWNLVSGGGAIGGWSASGEGLLGDYDKLGHEYFHRVFDLNDSRIGSAAIQALVRAATVDGISQDFLKDMILFGDPSQFLATDLDRDGLLDHDELAAGANPNDADTDDDGLVDGREPSYAGDADGDGTVNVRDFDDDDDGLPDGLESGVATPPAGTDTSRGFFRADADPATTTDPLRADTDGGGCPDGAEDRNANGKVDPGETNPNTAADDPVCATHAPAETSGVTVSKSGADVVVRWTSQTGADACVLYHVYEAKGPSVPATFAPWSRVMNTGQNQHTSPGAAADGQMHWYLVTGYSIKYGEGPLGHYGR